jgi:plasmid stability protein
MHTLHVRNVPEELYTSLRRRARERKTSISQETLRLLARALRTDRAGVRELFDEIESDRPVARRGTPAAAVLIRDDRERR